MKIKLIPLVGLLAIVAGATAQVTLEIKHQEKSSLTTQTDIKIAQTLQLAGQEMKTKNAQVLITEQAIGARVGDGTIRTKSTIKKWTAKWEFPGGIAMEFDSAVPDRKAPIAQLEPILEIVRVMLNTPITHVYGKDGLVKTVEIPEDAAKGLPDDFKDELKLAAQLKDLQAILPDKAGSKGDTWVRDQKSPLGGGQVMSFRIDYKYEGTVKRNGRELDHITGKVTSVGYDQEGEALGPLKVKDSELKPTKSSLEIFFDRKLGRYVEVKSLIQIKGDMTFEANGMELPGKLDLTMESNVKDLPPEKK
jgi:hypothetical protein